jgi:ATP-dependent DNA helicase, RecQ family
MKFESTGKNDSLEKQLVEIFNITTGFRDGQYDIITRLIQGKRVLAIQRTGWGKSLCYQMASLHYPHLTIVFSPLKALMRDQYLRCNEKYTIPAGIVSSDFSEEENKAMLRKAIHNDIKILFIAPERLANLVWRDHVTQMKISMIVIDEAHCISTWGHDFRPDYCRIKDLLNAMPLNTPILALTATANQRVEKDIMRQMGGNIEVVRGTMRRPNLHLAVIPLHGDQEKLCYLATVIPQLPGTGIIYTATRQIAEMIATFLNRLNIDAQYYHAGIEDTERQEIEQELQNNQHKVFCSTNALGMGIDKPDIRFVIHYNFPASPIYYYQEIGRAGRDSELAFCTLLYDEEDTQIQQYFIDSAKPQNQYYLEVLNAIKRSGSRGLRQKEILLNTAIPSQNIVQTILADLQEQDFIEKEQERYVTLSQSKQIDFSSYDIIRQHKMDELQAMKLYATQSDICYMNYITKYLGETSNFSCDNCSHCKEDRFTSITPSETLQQAVTNFLEENLPRIEKRGSQGAKHEAGYSLSYHGGSHIGNLVDASKYGNSGPFADELVQQAILVIRKYYSVESIDAIVSIPPTKSGTLVETFARNIANVLSITYVPALRKRRETKEQKRFVNKVQKEHNIKDAFIASSQLVNGRTLLLIDDIYDSGYTLRAATKALMQAGALTIYPFTITHTRHSDDR